MFPVNKGDKINILPSILATEIERKRKVQDEIA